MTTKYYYGWYIASALAITETISWGIIYYTFSVFITPMETELGWSRAELTGGFSLALLISGGMAFPVGYWLDKHGARLLMTVGSAAASLLVIAWSQVTHIQTFYLIWAGLGLCAAAVLYDPAFAVIATWFDRKRGRALALVTFAAGLASTIFLPLSDALLHTFGWRDSVLILGIFLAVTTIPLHALVLRRRPSDLGLARDGGTHDESAAAASRPDVSLRLALNSRSFWLLTVAFGLAGLATDSIRVHFIPLLIDIGVNPTTAAFASGSIGLMQVAGRAIFAPLEMRFSSRTMVSGVFGLQTVALSILLFGTSPGLILVFIVVFGAAFGAQTLARPAIVADLYGATHYGRISSVMSIFLTLARTAAPVGAGLVYDRFGSYQPVLWSVLVISCLAYGVTFLIQQAEERH